MHRSLLLVTLLCILPSTLSQPYDKPCTTHRIIAGVYSDGPVPLSPSPLTHFDAPMIPYYNATAGEDWSFDAVSSSSSSGLSLVLSRGTVGSKLAAQRMLISMTWPNRTRYMESVFADESTITQCAHTTTGTWLNHTTGANWTFAVSNDYARGAIIIASPTINGTYSITARTPPLYPDGTTYPSRNATTLFAPQLYWTENVPVGDVKAEFEVKGTSFVLHGMGGREHNWNAQPWGTISKRWDQIRAEVGLWTLMGWTYESRVVENTTCLSLIVMENGSVVARYTENQGERADGTYGSIALSNTGSVHLASAPGNKEPLPESRHSGYVVVLKEPRTGKEWRFEIEFTQTVYWFTASEIARIGQFVGTASGGLLGGTQFRGLTSGSLQELSN